MGPAPRENTNDRSNDGNFTTVYNLNKKILRKL